MNIPIFSSQPLKKTFFYLFLFLFLDFVCDAWIFFVISIFFQCQPDELRDEHMKSKLKWLFVHFMVDLSLFFERKKNCVQFEWVILQ